MSLWKSLFGSVGGNDVPPDNVTFTGAPSDLKPGDFVEVSDGSQISSYQTQAGNLFSTTTTQGLSALQFQAQQRQNAFGGFTLLCSTSVMGGTGAAGIGPHTTSQFSLPDQSGQVAKDIHKGIRALGGAYEDADYTETMTVARTVIRCLREIDDSVLEEAGLDPKEDREQYQGIIDAIMERL